MADPWGLGSGAVRTLLRFIREALRLIDSTSFAGTTILLPEC
jgi:hypothetical protein